MPRHLSALVCAGELALSLACASAPAAPPPQATELVGTWTLAPGANRDTSLPSPEDGPGAEDGVRPGRGGPRGGRGGGPPSGGRPGMGGRGGAGGGVGMPGIGRRPDAEALREAMATMRALLAPHGTLEVARADGVLSLRWDERTFEVPLDGESREVAWEGLDEEVEVEAAWDDDELVLKRRSGDVEVVERWTHARGSSRLVVDVEVHGPMPRDLVVRRIYDRARAQR